MIESMVPKIAATIVGSVIFPAIDTLGFMRAGVTCLSSGGVQPVKASPTTASERVVVLTAVRPRAVWTLDLRGMTGLGGMAPLPAANTEGKAWVGPCRLEVSHILPKLDGATDESLGSSTADQVSNVEINCRRVRRGGVPDNPGASL
jgi:hypothetical protein